MALEVGHMAWWGPWLAPQLQLWNLTFISDHDALPWNLYSWWNSSLLEDEDLVQD